MSPAPGGELADQIGELAVIRIAARGTAQDRDSLGGDAPPVTVERFGAGVEEHVAGVVGWPGGIGEQVGDQCPSERIGGEDVEALVAGQCGRAGDRIKRPTDVGPDRLFGLASTTRRDVGPGAAREIERMDALGVVELQRLSEGVKDTA